MTDWFKPDHVTQRDPKDPLQFSHCWAACGAWLVGAATGGTSKLTAKEFAAAAGGGSGRKPGSGTQEDIVLGLAHYGIRSKVERVSLAWLTGWLKEERRGVVAIPTDYDKWPVEKDCMGGTAGPDVNHEVGVIGGAKLGIMNPLCGDYQSIKLTELMAAASKYARQNGHAGVIEIVRVQRPLPSALPEMERQLAELQAQVTDMKDAFRQVADLVAQISEILK